MEGLPSKMDSNPKQNDDTNDDHDHDHDHGREKVAVQPLHTSLRYRQFYVPFMTLTTRNYIPRHHLIVSGTR